MRYVVFLRNLFVDAVGWGLAPFCVYFQVNLVRNLRGKDVLVLGSAPTPSLPENVQDLVVVCCNGSAANLKKLGLKDPVMTVVDNELVDKEIAFTKDVRRSVVEGKILAGLNLGILVSTQSNPSRGGSPEILGGKFDRFLQIRKFTRRWILDRVTGTCVMERNSRISLCSTGGFAVGLCAFLGARSVTVAGFTHVVNPSQASFYEPLKEVKNQVLDTRNHSLADSALISLAVINGHIIKTGEQDILPLVQNWGNKGPGW